MDTIRKLGENAYHGTVNEEVKVKDNELQLF